MINQTQQKKLQKTQNKCNRLIDTRHNVAEIRRNYNILSINELTKLENYKLWYREQGNCLPKYLLKQMRVDHQRQTIRKKHGYDTCNKRQMNLPMARSKAYHNSFLFKGLREFQLLPNEIKSEQCELKFIKKCKQELLKQALSVLTNSCYIIPISITYCTHQIFKVLTLITTINI